jgi:hypothetical protein
MDNANPKKQKQGRAPLSYETMLARVVARAADITSGRAMLSLLAAAQVRGVVAEPPRSRGFITDVFAHELALRTRTRRRGFNIILHGKPYDPMLRRGETPVYRLTETPTPTPSAPAPKALPKSAPATPSAPEPVLRTKDGDELVEVEDEPTPCPYCRGRKYVVDDLGERHICPDCEGHGIVLLE